MADAIKTALSMPMEERKQRQRENFKYVTTFTSSHWGKTFVDTLEECTVYAYKVPAYSSAVLGELGERLRNSRKRLFVIDDDGTLVALQRSFALAKPEPETLKVLARLNQLPGAEVLVVSGRDRSTLNQWFADLPIGIVAEHGYYVQRAGSDEWDSPHGGGKE
jgi:trehalose 6-phosphate synthase/phosphatase